MSLYSSGFSDRVIPKGFLSKEEIFNYATESQIFYMVFGFFPKEYEYIVSPFREDTTPGAYFESMYNEVDGREKMYFVDWADEQQINRDCFDCVRDKFQLTSFYHTLDFIKENLIIRNNLQKIVQPSNSKHEVKKKVKAKILFKPRRFMDQDKNFWFPYGITKKQLVKDNVFPVSKYLVSKNESSYYQPAYTLTFAYSGFDSNNIKLYFPFKKTDRFITTCSKNDIGGLNFLFESPKLVITKSYKDYRVLKNAGCNSVWFQNEGMIPDDIILEPLVKNFEDIIVFYDNDSTGINAGIKVSNHINYLLEKEVARPLHLPTSLIKRNITDPADYRKIGGKDKLNKFLLKHDLL